MTIKYVNVPHEFNWPLWNEAIAKGIEEIGIELLAQTLEVNEITLKQWTSPNGYAYRNFKWPSMGNFLKVCNELNLRPSDFFTTGDPK